MDGCKGGEGKRMADDRGHLECEKRIRRERIDAGHHHGVDRVGQVEDEDGPTRVCSIAAIARGRYWSRRREGRVAAGACGSARAFVLATVTALP
eukprot:scaffold64749_cov28-Tisochrysis_lutea.AAC.12